MSKAILVLDEMPEYCDSCPCCDEEWDQCIATGEELTYDVYFLYENGCSYKKPDWCPLRELPERQANVGPWELGWNACLKYVLGESEETYEDV